MNEETFTALLNAMEEMFKATGDYMKEMNKIILLNQAQQDKRLKKIQEILERLEVKP